LDEGISGVGLSRILEVQGSVDSLINNGVVEYTHAIRLYDDVTWPVEDFVTSLECNGVVVLNSSKSRVRVVKVSWTNATSSPHVSSEVSFVVLVVVIHVVILPNLGLSV
jgi:hypothetical protein